MTTSLLPPRNSQVPIPVNPLRPWCSLILTTGLLTLGSLTAPAAHSADFTLVGSELKYRVIAQATPTSELFVTSFPASAIVSETAVEFPDITSLFDPSAGSPPGFARRYVDVAIDVGPNYIESDYAGFGRFATGFQNTSVFTFADEIALQITEATIDPATTLGLTPDRVTFQNNELFVNGGQGLFYNPNSFVRINLNGTLNPTPDDDLDPATVPEPGTLAFLGGAVLFGLVIRQKDHQQ